MKKKLNGEDLNSFPLKLMFASSIYFYKWRGS